MPASAGFTLIELLVVLAIVAMLLTLAVPRYFQSIDNAKETLLIENLRLTRDTLDKYYGDTGHYPESLEELVTKKYLRALPIDPVSNAPWVLISPDGENTKTVYNLKSSSQGKTRTGIAFADL